MKSNLRAGLAGLLITLAVAPAALAADVTVRAEGFDATVLPQTTVSNLGTDNTVGAKQFSCPTAANTARSAAGALERATASNWDGSSSSFGLSVERILAKDLGGFSPTTLTYWNFDVNNSSQQVGICDVDPQAGDEILFYEACATASATACFTGMPLGITAPVVTTAGQPFTVTVREFDDFATPVTSAPSVGATVAGGGQTATTNAAGEATFTFSAPGPITLVATKGRQVRDSATVELSTPYSIQIPGVPPRDETAPVSRVRAPQNGKVFEGRGPRRLRAAITDDGALASVKLALTRRVGKRCTAFRGASERFTKARCGTHPRFAVGTGRALSFLLPSRLGPGKYVLDVVATDAAGNAEALERGRNRVVFRVR